MKKRTHETFILDMLKILEKGTKILSEYVDSHTPVKVVCINGHTRNILPGSVYKTNRSGSLCRVCNPITKPYLTIKQAQDKINTNIQLLEYTGYNNICTYKCLTCNTINNSSIFNTLVKYGDNICKTCTPSKVLSLDEVNSNFTSRFPTLEVLSYKDSHSNATFKCKICEHTWTNIYSNTYSSNKEYTRCKNCEPKNTSLYEKELLSFIKDNYTGWIIENDRINLEGQELDIVLPDLGLAFEYNGVYWHSDKFKDKHYHLNKTIKLKENIGYQLIHINSDEWLTKQDIIKSRILSLLEKSNKIYARKCEIKEISWPKEFLNTNHLQGAGSPTSINLGLFYNNNLVSVMTFSKPRFSVEYDYELVRYCSIINTTIIGGASKLFNYFNKHYIGSIVSYSDKRWSSGTLYKILGFVFSHSSEPNYRYYKGNISLSRYQCQKHKLAELLGNNFDPTMTEYENMNNAGYYKVYDCGNDVWVF